MPFTFTNYKPSSPEEFPFNDLIGKFLQGYKDTSQARYLQPTLHEDLLKKQQFNQFYPDDMRSKIGERNANAGHLGSLTAGQNISNRELGSRLHEQLLKQQYENQYLPKKLQQEEQDRGFKLDNPMFGHAGVTGQVADYLYLQRHPELMSQINGGQQGGTIAQQQGMQGSSLQSQSPNPIMQMQSPQGVQPMQQGIVPVAPGQKDPLLQAILRTKGKEFAKSPIGKLQNELSTIRSGINPSTGQPFSSIEEQYEAAAPYEEKLGNLPPATHYVYDEDHRKIGEERPTSPEESRVIGGREAFNTLFPISTKGVNEYIGKGSIRNLDKDANSYGVNPDSTRRIDDLILSNMLMSSTAINEMATLGAGKTNVVYRNLKKGLGESDIPQRLQNYELNYKIPKEAFQRQSAKAQRIINQATEQAAKSIPAMQQRLYNPKKPGTPHYSDRDIQETARKHGISVDQVRKALKGNK